MGLIKVLRYAWPLLLPPARSHLQDYTLIPRKIGVIILKIGIFSGYSSLDGSRLWRYIEKCTELLTLSLNTDISLDDIACLQIKTADLGWKHRYRSLPEMNSHGQDGNRSRPEYLKVPSAFSPLSGCTDSD